MISDLEIDPILESIVVALWQGSIKCPSFSTWFETASFLDFLSMASKCNRAAKEELESLSKLAELIGQIKSKQ